jgi:hypothetical protein
LESTKQRVEEDDLPENSGLLACSPVACDERRSDVRMCVRTKSVCSFVSFMVPTKTAVWRHEGGTYVKFTDSRAALFAKIEH